MGEVHLREVYAIREEERSQLMRVVLSRGCPLMEGVFSRERPLMEGGVFSRGGGGGGSVYESVRLCKVSSHGGVRL